jgi:hypothetical protein
VLVGPKSVTPAFDRVIGAGLAFNALIVLSDFWFDEGVFVWLPEPPLLLGPCGILLFTTISLTDGTGAKSGLDHYIFCNVCFHRAYK